MFMPIRFICVRFVCRYLNLGRSGEAPAVGTACPQSKEKLSTLKQALRALRFNKLVQSVHFRTMQHARFVNRCIETLDICMSVKLKPEQAQPNQTQLDVLVPCYHKASSARYMASSISVSQTRSEFFSFPIACFLFILTKTGY